MAQHRRSRNAWKKWQRLVSEQASSGQSVAAYCRERKLCAPHFYWWKKRLRKRTAARFVKVQVADSSSSAPSESRIELRLQNGRSLLIGRGFDPEHVRALLTVVEAAR